jgi:hypothetical protein
MKGFWCPFAMLSWYFTHSWGLGIYILFILEKRERSKMKCWRWWSI